MSRVEQDTVPRPVWPRLRGGLPYLALLAVLSWSSGWIWPAAPPLAAAVFAALLGAGAAFWWGRRRLGLMQASHARTQQELMQAVDQLGTGLMAIDPAGLIVHGNRRFANLLGREAEALAGLAFVTLFHPDDLKCCRRLLSTAADTTSPPQDLRILRPDGRLLWVRVRMSCNPGAGLPVLQRILTAEDIDELKTGHVTLQHRERLLRAVVDSIPDAIGVRDLHGAYLLANPALAELLQRPVAQIVSHPVGEVHGADQARALIDADHSAVALATSIHRETHHVGLDGRRVVHDTSTSVLRDDQGEPFGVVSIGRDVTAMREVSERLTESSARTQTLLLNARDSRLALLSLLEDQRRAVRALALNEARLRAVMAALPDLVFLFDDQGRFIDIWASRTDMLIAPREQVLGRRIGEIVPAPLAELAMERLALVLRSGQLQVFEYSLGLREQQHWFEMRMVRAGEQEVLAVARDITRDRQNRGALEHSEARLRLALEGSGDGLWDWDLKSDTVRFSEQVERMLAYEGSDFHREFRLLERLHPDDVVVTRRAIRDTLARRIVFDRKLRVRGFDGHDRWLHARGMVQWDPQRQSRRFSGVITDKTHEMEAQARLRLAATVFDSTLEGVLITDASQRIVSVNPAFTRLLGYTEEEVIGRTPACMASGRHSDTFFQQMWQTIARSGHWQGEIWNRCKDGVVRPELMSISAVFDDQAQVSHYVGVFTDISELKNSEAKLDHLAHHDPLTQLPNRLLFRHRLEQALLTADRNEGHLAVLMLDLDRFKDVNDSYGHLAGDELLCHVADRLSQRLRKVDTLARLGGDEFALLMQDVKQPDDAARLASELIESLSQPWRLGEGIELSVGVSVGICLYPEHGQTAQALMQGADAALYRAKSDGRGVYRYFADDLTLAARERLQLENRLRRALVDEQLQLHFQPQIDIASGRVIGAEALLRWPDPVEGMIPPARFIPVAESTGLIDQLGAWVLRHACEQGQRWIEQGLPPLSMAVNVSPRQFHHIDLAHQVQQVLADTGFPAERLELELTEGALMEREAESLRMLERLRDMGVRVAIDDFGTGYSSFSYLKRFPLDVLKIDRSFITDIPRDIDDMEIAAAIIAMGHNLGVRVLAEGVETAEQLAFLGLKRCDSYQGFLLSPALPADEFAALLRDQPATLPCPQP
ncbi:PAS domain S-box-containing protein/diguanylate cyclase (GGDEF)-like protein [Sphaerotilus hippei]|uniref:PAS domain S-box-containing protein/diguanylate cyclase (GGDEF)-like protein n=1 Tax=Sphaerotilus hippei TaxID=744406 RepID=A0A318H4J2_9BURK|nr:EAL domain-containing protein [Sphaerotilus hippei]PXW98081.1 PAS domain S-box-containing protein/diguanylate cyclase (GGDEF)-like protein [Sphaerotilus hippei]